MFPNDTPNRRRDDVAAYQTTVRTIRRCGADIILATLELPEGYQYRAGQWFRLTLVTPDGPETRTLSHAAAPSDGVIELATRLSPSSFKQALDDVVEGDRVEISASGGRLALPAEPTNVTFLAGGVGITPIRSLVRDAGANGSSLQGALLLYGNRDESCIPYREELEGYAHAGLTTVHVLEHPSDGWKGESGFITADVVRRHVRPEDRTFIISGPPVMVEAMERLLDELSVPAAQRKVESFGPRQPAAIG